MGYFIWFNRDFALCALTCEPSPQFQDTDTISYFPNWYPCRVRTFSTIRSLGIRQTHFHRCSWRIAIGTEIHSTHSLAPHLRPTSFHPAADRNSGQHAKSIWITRKKRVWIKCSRRKIFSIFFDTAISRVTQTATAKKFILIWYNTFYQFVLFDEEKTEE